MHGNMWHGMELKQLFPTRPSTIELSWIEFILILNQTSFNTSFCHTSWNVIYIYILLHALFFMHRWMSFVLKQTSVCLYVRWLILIMCLCMNNIINLSFLVPEIQRFNSRYAYVLLSKFLIQSSNLFILFTNKKTCHKPILFPFILLNISHLKY